MSETKDDDVRGGYKILTPACKRALRPEPPDVDMVCELESAKDGDGCSLTPRGWELLYNWVEYVLEHGWEVE